jgi:glycosyltransferase involved in cell wall biosynthesis
MSVYNEPLCLLTDAIESILKQTHSNIQFIIVVDNPKNTNVIEQIKAYKERDNRIDLIINSNNIGLAESLNIALKNANGQFIARMDADDISTISRIEKQLKFLNENPKIDLVTSLATFINEQGVNIDYRNIFVQSDDDKLIRKMLRYNNFICHPSWLIRKKTILELNGYRNFPALQDYDFLLRFIDAGYNLAILENRLIKYRIREDSISISKNYGLKIMYQRYIQKLSKERVKHGIDSYDYNLIKELDIKNSIVQNISKAKITYDYANKMYNQKRFIKAIKFLLLSLFRSKDFRKNFLNQIKAKILMRKFRY